MTHTTAADARGREFPNGEDAGSLASDAAFRQLAELLPQLVWSTTPDGYHDYFNARWYAYTGMPRPDEAGGEHEVPQGWSWKDYLHPDDVEPAQRVWGHALATGEPYEIEYRFREAATGAYRWFLGRALPMRDAAGAIVRWFGTCTDIDDSKQAALATQVVSEAGIALGESLDVDASVVAATRLIVPRLADWAAIDLVGEDGRAHRIAVAHADPEKVALARALAERFPDRPDAESAVGRVIRTGAPELVADITPAVLERAARSPEHLAALRALGLCSYLVVPIHDARGHVTASPLPPGEAPAPARGVLGALTLVAAEAGRRFGALELHTAEELARRVALALERGRLYRMATDAEQQRSAQAMELRVQNEQLQQQAVELEMQAAQLEEQGTESAVQAEELQRANDELRAVEERLRLATAAAEIGTWDFDPIGGSLVWDASCRAAFGVPDGAPVDYERFLHYVHPEDRARVDAAARRALDPRGDGDYDVEYRTLGPDGVVRWIHATGQAYFADVATGGRPERRAVRFVGTVLDVSERLRAADALRASEERYRAIIEVSPQVVWQADAAGMVNFANQFFYDFAQLSPHASIAEQWLEVLHPDDRQRVVAAWSRAVATGTPYEVEARLHRAADDAYCWFLIRARAMHGVGGAVVRWVGTAVDIDAQKRVEEAQREEAQLVETLQRVGSAFASQLNRDRLIQLVTDEATQLTGAQFGAFFYNVTDQRGESYTLYTISGVPREHFSKFPMPRNTHVFAPTFRGDGPVRSDDILKDPRYGHNPPYHGMPEGHLPVRSYLAVPVISHSGEVMGGLFFGHAEPCRFTARHERLVVGVAGWAALALDNARLYEAAEAARHDAERARERADEANRAKSQFLATMSHELRTPLNAIGGYADLLLMGVRGALSDGQREDVERVKRSGQHLLSLINDILNFAKLEAGQVEFHVEAIALAPVLDALEDLVLPQVAAKALRYTYDSCDGGLRVLADEEKLRQVLLNLLTNAMKFTEAGGEMTLTCEPDEHWVHVRVRDTGRGIEPDQLERIFDPFVQVDRHLTPVSQQGVGLGLAISRDLAHAMGGSLSAESQAGRGSTFTLSLRRAAET